MKLPSYQELSKEQDRINNLPLDGSYLVTGPPGTGKTVMALYRSQMLTKRSNQVQLLMHSRLLSQYTDSAIEELAIDGVVKTFHSWFYGFYQSVYKETPPEIEKFVFDWQQILMTINVNPPPENSLPYLLVDEGQDFAEAFYLVARHLAKHLTIFADENQRLDENNSTLAAIQRNAGIAERFELLRNYRNSREIANLAAAFCTGLPTGVPDLPQRRGEKPKVIRHDSLHETVEFISRYERNHSDLEIGVLTPTKRLQTQFFNRLTGKTTNSVQTYVGGKGKLADPVNFGAPGIKVINYQSAKGLEFDTMFLPEMGLLTDDPQSTAFKMRFYVLVSRARDELFLLYSGEGEPQIFTSFPRDLLEWQ